ncbi:MAG: RecQ family ATP-dependent DNA helicase [Ignavibacteria bacterium]|nr:RecQ family ATP-dependent DNA helicase [Ignavibacteria bacterium]
MTSVEYAKKLLKERFNYDAFRPGQEEIIGAILAGNNVLGVLPTGAGKSVCYQIPALIVEHTTLVVSPLIALMKDQADALNQKNISARVLHSGVNSGDSNNILYEASRGQIRVLFVAPERLENKSFRQTLRDIPISLVVVDEAHCISEWGHDFRPAYQNISTIFEHIPLTPILALTATATPDVRTDIRKRLLLEKCVEIVRGFDRPNLAFQVVNTSHKSEFVARSYYNQASGAVIVYCGSRRKVDTMYEELKKRKLPVLAYHAGMPSDKRASVQEEFISAASPILIATNAFGMGIDKSDVRHVIHADLTLTLEAYYQEAGRAGRDGQKAICTLLFEKRDQQLMNFFIDCANPDISKINQVYSYLYDRLRVAVGGGSPEPIQADDASIASDLDTPVQLVRTCLTLLAKYGILIQQSERGYAQIEIRTSRERMAEYESNSPLSRQKLIQSLLRSLSNQAYSRAVDFSVQSFLMENGFSNKEFADAIGALQVARLIRFKPPALGSSIILLKNRMQSVASLLDVDLLVEKRKNSIEKLHAVLRYVETNQCKRNFILGYFADPEIHGDCGRCSSCLARNSKHVKVHSARSKPIVESLINTAAELGGAYGRNVIVDVLIGTPSAKVVANSLDQCSAWSKHSSSSRSELLRELDGAVSRNELIKTSDRYPVIKIGPKGKDLIGVLPSPLQFRKKFTRVSDDVEIRLQQLSVLRREIATEASGTGSAVLTDLQLLRIAKDHPSSLSDLKAGIHGSGLTLARYGERIVHAISSTSSMVQADAPVASMDTDIRKLIELVRPKRTLDDVAKLAGVTKATASQLLQRALEAGVELDMGAMVDEILFSNVLEFMRYNRYAKLRNVREHIDADVELPELRLAVAFVRRLLMNEVQ